MAICALSYLGVRSERLDEWSDFAGRLLGMQKVELAGKSLSFRMDDQMQRLHVSNEPGDTLAFLGFEVQHKEDLRYFAEKLDRAGIRVHVDDRSLADRRFVRDLVWFLDPMGNRVELVWSPMVTTDAFVPGRPIEGFKTGPLGMGHAVLHVEHMRDMLPLYRDLLGFRVSDYGLTPYGLYFFHLNERHHSFAMVESGKTGFHHFMVEFCNLDDVGQGYDLAQMEDDRIAYTLGRHTNDYMLSYYANSPSGFFVENGWGGRLINPDTWEPHETTVGPSFWGHDRLYLPEKDPTRQRLADMRHSAAASGLRAPAVIDCPWLYNEISGK